MQLSEPCTSITPQILSPCGSAIVDNFSYGAEDVLVNLQLQVQDR